ncbi:T-lymphocyte surface antigen Ly-9 isoform X2 [Xenopus laevis]|uniref:T-lymphocyte surface antigen Ly-9 isoform X2 n=1 Tax=Xenopus laevis TaxID=8355 RepID=A0A8J1LL82_XENLA|nr:T-lymphocyte surface antigen Ly-9 isoform X2 [Xenopus laevis]
MEHIELIYLLSLVLQTCCVTGKDPDPLTGHVQGSVELLYNIPVPVDLAIWDFSCSGKKGKVAEFIQQKFSITREEFRSRLECSNNGTTLIIRNLTKEDSGIYTVQIYDTEHDKYEMSYNLSVFELVPKPQIKEEEKRNETGQCNYTLHCSVPSDSSALSYSWMYRYNNSEYHHYANGSTIHISSHNKPLECICLVRNPAHKNNDTFVLPACSEILMEEKKRRRDSLIIMICVCGPFAGLAVAQVFLFVRKRRQRKKTVPSRNGFSSNPLLHSETTYIDVKR